jgi:hypothetical protein
MCDGVPFGTPLCGTFEMSTARSVVIDGWIGGSDPFSEILAQLISCKRGQAFVIGAAEVRRSRTALVADVIDHMSNRYSGLLHT